MFRIPFFHFRKLRAKYILFILALLFIIVICLYHGEVSREERLLQINEKIYENRNPRIVIQKPIVPQFKKQNITINIHKSNRTLAIIEAMRHSWKAYKLYAWGHDEVYPLTKGSSTWMGAALTMIDSLDLLYIMDMKDEFQECVEYIRNNLHFDLDKNHVNVFETTIRVLGGLLSAFHLSKEPILLEKAIDLGEHLLPAFNTPTGIPRSDINLKTRKSSNPEWSTLASTSEAYTVILELYELSRVSGQQKYKIAAERIVQAFNKAEKTQGLVPIHIDPMTGMFHSNTITLGARGDSYYEYMLKYFIQTGKTNRVLYRDYIEAVEGIQKLLVKKSSPNGLVFIAELLPQLNPKMDHLVCFLPGTLALGTLHGMNSDHLNLAKQLMNTCYQMYKQMPTGLSPEIVYFNTKEGSDALVYSADSPIAEGSPLDSRRDIVVKDADKYNLQRPETVESLFYLYRITGDEKYREWAWEIFQAFDLYERVPEAGYVSIDNVMDPANVNKRSKCESFWYSETLKYLFLIFANDYKQQQRQSKNNKNIDSDMSEDPVLYPFDRYVFNTEGHAFPIVPIKMKNNSLEINNMT